MPRIHGPAVGIDPGAHAVGGFGALDRSVVAGCADALQVGRIEEERQIAPMRFTVVDDASGDDLANLEVGLTERLVLQLGGPEPLPARRAVVMPIGRRLGASAVITPGQRGRRSDSLGGARVAKPRLLRGLTPSESLGSYDALDEVVGKAREVVAEFQDVVGVDLRPLGSVV